MDLKNNIENSDMKKFVNKIRKFDSFSTVTPNIKEMMPYFDDLEPIFYSYLMSGGFPDAILEYLKKEFHQVYSERSER